MLKERERERRRDVVVGFFVAVCIFYRAVVLQYGAS